VALNFSINSFNPSRSIEFSLLLLLSGDSAHETEVGHFSIMSTSFIEQFNEHKTSYFQNSVNLSQKYSLTF
jgi:hypothetical protein